MSGGGNGSGFSPYGLDLFGDSAERRPASPVAARFTVPPFSVLSARDGSWQDRKRAWLSLGIKSENGRNANSYNISDRCSVARKRGRVTNVSVFDPVLCEVVYKWFSDTGDMVLDPFAGGSVRGITAAMMIRRYHGIELREEQVEANLEQARRIVIEPSPPRHGFAVIA